ncbi:MAG: 50S ribosomal protein L23 [Firmicutes bacterium]|jgi:large subunit ribosomal protein L23|nr:50S ribosomal protein L23 [Bacillota bacterium]
MESYQILLRPVVTEHAMAMQAEGKYTFRVPLRATKPEIARAVEEMFGVEVRQVRTMHMHGKPRRRGKWAGHTQDWKKAIVTLAPGKSIQFFEGV